jgi:hypothetical protein
MDGATFERIQMLDELYYDAAHISWAVSPWTPSGYGTDRDAIVEDHQEKQLDRRCVYASDAIIRNGVFHVKQIGEVIASDD